MTTKAAKRTAPPFDLDYLRPRFWGKVEIGEEGECWPWKQSCNSVGYGQTWDGITVRPAHRVAWELTHGRIPGKLTVDHICHNRPCCNPHHLRLLENVENARDNGFARRTHCPQGHPYDEMNTYTDPKGHRRCRTCAKARYLTPTR